jgi:hypothetical protein
MIKIAVGILLGIMLSICLPIPLEDDLEQEIEQQIYKYYDGGEIYVVRNGMTWEGAGTWRKDDVPTGTHGWVKRCEVHLTNGEVIHPGLPCKDALKDYDEKVVYE